MYLGHGCDDRTRIAAGRTLLNCDGRGQSLDLFDIRLLHLVEKLPCVRTQGFHIAALPLGVERIERKRTLSASGKTGDDSQRIPRNRDVNIPQIVLIRPVYPYITHVTPPLP